MKKKNVRRTCQWFAETPDKDTNEIIATMLAELAHESACGEMLCADGKRHNLWHIPAYRFVEQILRSAHKDCRLSDIRIFRRQGTSGKPSPWKFGRGEVARRRYRGAPFQNLRSTA